MATLKENFEFFLSKKAELVGKYSGKYVVIADLHVVDAFDSEIKAVEEAQKRFPPGSYVVQLVSPGDEAYSQTYHSRVSFA